MSDLVPPNITPGHETSEFSLAKVVVWLSMALATLGGVSEVLGILAKTFPNPFIAKLMLLLGVGSAVLTSVAYTLSRLSLKKAVLKQPVLSVEEATKELKG